MELTAANATRRSGKEAPLQQRERWRGRSGRLGQTGAGGQEFSCCACCLPDAQTLPASPASSPLPLPTHHCPPPHLATHWFTHSILRCMAGSALTAGAWAGEGAAGCNTMGTAARPGARHSPARRRRPVQPCTKPRTHATCGATAACHRHAHSPAHIHQPRTASQQWCHTCPEQRPHFLLLAGKQHRHNAADHLCAGTSGGGGGGV